MQQRTSRATSSGASKSASKLSQPDSLAWLDDLPEEARDALLKRVRYQLARNRIADYYPDTGPLRRSLYPKHQAFLAAGAKERVRMMMAGNRVGKSEGCGLYELTWHMLGRYPEWWKGRRFLKRPVKVWVCGDTSKTVREILQPKLLGPWKNFGTGLLPGDDLLGYTSKQGVAEAIDTFSARHSSGGISTGVFKSYDQGREAFQGSEQDVILLDEEPPDDVYAECLMRTTSTGAFGGGIIMLTFTPLKGLTKLIKEMREAGVWEVGCTWDDVPHLSKDEKEDLWRNTPAYMREARFKGVPQRGSGVVFPVSEQTITVEPFVTPKLWPCIGGIDFGAGDHPTAAVKMVHNREDDVLYVVGAYRQKEATPLLFSDTVLKWGSWLPWAWPHDGLRMQLDPRGAKPMMELYRGHGMRMLPDPASFTDSKLDNGVEAGIADMLDYMQAGRFKVMSHLSEWFEEFRDYYREDGIIVKVRDDLMAATRYAFMCRRFAMTRPGAKLEDRKQKNWRVA